jgi:hypothetical protein
MTDETKMPQFPFGLAEFQTPYERGELIEKLLEAAWDIVSWYSKSGALKHKPELIQVCIEAARDVGEMSGLHNFGDSQFSDYCEVLDIVEILDSLAPEGYRFGICDGDDDHYGYWQKEIQ